MTSTAAILALYIQKKSWGESHDASDGRHRIQYWPGIKLRALPDWLWEIKVTPFRETLEETYRAFNKNQPVLAAAGTRIVFDLLARKLLGIDAGSFTQKLDALYKDGHLSEKQKTTIGCPTNYGVL